MKKLTIWQRIISDTPAFFKRAQLFGVGLMSLAASLSQIGIIPGQIIAVVTAVGATVTAVSQFAVKQTEGFESQK